MSPIISSALRSAYRLIVPRDRSSDRSDWVSERFAEASLFLEPCPHLIIENILPPELYVAMEQDIPVNGREMAIDVARPGRSPLPLARHALRWKRRYLPYIQLIGSLVKQAMRAASADYAKELVSLGLYSEAQPQKSSFQELCVRSQGWAIRPHVHDLQQAIQWMIYFPLPGSTEAEGTSFYRLTTKKLIAAADLAETIWFEPNEVEYCLTAPYRPNTLVAFLNTPSAIHGAVATNASISRRYIFAGSLWRERPNPIDITWPAAASRS